MIDDKKRLSLNGLDYFWDKVTDYIDNYLMPGEESEGTVNSITAGIGLTGGTISRYGTVGLKYASQNEIGGIRINYNSSTKICNIYNTNN